MIANLPEKTGKTLAQWIRIATQAPVAGDADRAAWLVKEHGLGHFQARLVVSEAKAKIRRRAPDERDQCGNRVDCAHDGQSQGG